MKTPSISSSEVSCWRRKAVRGTNAHSHSRTSTSSTDHQAFTDCWHY